MARARTDDAAYPADVIAELRAMRALMEQQKPDRDEGRAAKDGPSQDVRRLRIELDVIGNAIRETRCEIVSLQDQGFDSDRVARVTRELEAVFNDTTGATERILKAAEDIDQNAHALAGLLKGGHEQGLAQDIQERVTAIFEACNFHDLTGQRISKVAEMLKLVEEHLARMMEIWSVIDRFNVACRPIDRRPARRPPQRSEAQRRQRPFDPGRDRQAVSLECWIGSPLHCWLAKRRGKIMRTVGFRTLAHGIKAGLLW